MDSSDVNFQIRIFPQMRVSPTDVELYRSVDAVFGDIPPPTDFSEATFGWNPNRVHLIDGKVVYALYVRLTFPSLPSHSTEPKLFPTFEEKGTCFVWFDYTNQCWMTPDLTSLSVSYRNPLGTPPTVGCD